MKQEEKELLLNELREKSDFYKAKLKRKYYLSSNSTSVIYSLGIIRGINMCLSIIGDL